MVRERLGTPGLATLIFDIGNIKNVNLKWNAITNYLFFIHLFIHFTDAFTLGRDTRAAALGRLRMPQDQQQS